MNRTDTEAIDEALEIELMHSDDPPYLHIASKPPPSSLNYKRAKRTSTLFEDARGTNRMHKIYLLIIRCMTAFALLCMALSLLIKESEIKELLNPSTDRTLFSPSCREIQKPSHRLLHADSQSDRLGLNGCDQHFQEDAILQT